ncbi:MAG: hypothetical protein KAT05_03380 [Spirochaetes bacterium]|nr:hypothetical protein [Spirochaetota bacterium]
MKKIKLIVFFILISIKIFSTGFEDEIKKYLKDIELNPGNYWGYINLSGAYIKKGNEEQNDEYYNIAINYANQALELYENDKVYGNRGLAYFLKGIYDNAISDFTEAIKLNTDGYRLYSLRAESYFIKGMYKHAIKDIEKSTYLGDKIHYYYFIHLISSFKISKAKYKKSLRLIKNIFNKDESIFINEDWSNLFIQCILNGKNIDDLLLNYDGKEEKLSYIHFLYIGYVYLINSDNNKANIYFKKCLETINENNINDRVIYNITKKELELLN